METYVKRKGVIDLGKGYEYLTAALHVLKFITDDDVDDFQMITNNDQTCDKLDDIEIKVDFKNGERKTFLCQLKHKLDKEQVTNDMLTKGSYKCGNKEIKSRFFLPYYFKSIQAFGKDHNTIFILYTNRPTSIEDGTVLSFKKYPSLLAEECKGGKDQVLLANTEHPRRMFQFRVKEDVNNQDKTDEQIEIEKTCQQFYFFSNQLDIESLKKQIREKLDAIFINRCDIYSLFVQFMEHWWSENFALTKHLVLAKLTEFSLSSYIKTLSDQSVNTKTDILKKAIMEFELTIVDPTEETVVRNMWTEIQEDCDLELITTLLQTSPPLTEQQQTLIVWHLNKGPLILKVEEENEDLIKTVLKLLKRKIDRKMIILLGKCKRCDFKEWKVFENLLDLTNKCSDQEYRVIKEFYVSLQGKSKICLQDFIDQDIAEHLKVSDLLKMTQLDHLLIGKAMEKFCDLHIPRNISVTLINIKNITSLLHHAVDAVVIINCSHQFQAKLGEISNTKIKELSNYQTLKNETGSCILLSSNRKCTYAEFEKMVRLGHSNVYLLEELDNDKCVLLLQKGSQSPKFEEMFISENNVFEYCHGFLKVFCASPGMGKSRIMKLLSHNYTPKENWIIHVNLINCNAFFATNPNFAATWKYFISLDKSEDALTAKIKTILWKTKKIHLFLDGLDEMDSSFVPLVLRFVKKILDDGVYVWVSSRENLRQQITDTLHVIPAKIKPLDQKQQRRFITEKLTTFNAEQTENIIAAIFSSTDLNNSQDLLGVPLQLHIITEMFLSKPEIYKSLHQKNMFVLTRMYEHYFQGQLENYFKKVVSEDLLYHLRSSRTRILKEYERLALDSCLDRSDREKLYLDDDTEEFLDDLKRNGDRYGIVTVNEQDEVTFNHQTYAEFFVCVWFKRNTKRITLLKEKIFSTRYENIRLMFDLMMAEDNPLHLAVIYKSVEHVRRHKDELHIKDKCGRTALHLASSYGMKYPENVMEQTFERRENAQWLEIMDIVAQEDTTLTEIDDDLFKFDVITYALKSNCLYPFEKFLEKNHKFEEMKNALYSVYQVDTIAYYAAKFGYENLLTHLVQENSTLINQQLVDGQFLLTLAVFGCQGDDYTTPRKGNVAVAKLLLEKGANANQELWNSLSLLDHSCRLGIQDMLMILSDSGARCSNGDTVLHRLVAQPLDIKQVKSVISASTLDINLTNKQGTSAFQLACKNGNFEAVETLLENGADHQHLDNTSQSALHYSARNVGWNLDVINLLLDKELNLDAQDNNGHTALHLACLHGSLPNSMLLLQRGANPKIRNLKSETALHSAARHPNSFVIRWLIEEHHLDVNDKNSDELTPFHLACQLKSLYNLQTVLNYDIDLTIVDQDNQTLLHYVVKFINEFDNQLIQRLLCHIDINAQDKNGRTALHIACTENNLEGTKLLLYNDADVNIPDKMGRTVLHHAVDEEDPNTDLTRLLLSNDANINAKNSSGATVLHLACANCDYELLEILVDNGADLFALDNDSQNAYFYLVDNEEVDENIIRLLIEHEVDINHKNIFDVTPLAEAIANNHEELEQLLLKYGAKNSEETSTFLQGCNTGDFEKVKNFLETRDCFNIVDKDEDNGLHYASLSEQDNEKIIRLLINKGFDVNVRNRSGETALHRACEVGNYANVEVLICNGAKVNALDDFDNTPLLTALSDENSNAKIVNLLLRKGADANLPNKDKNTPLHFACEEGVIELVQELLNRGADINALDGDGCNSLHYVSWGLDEGTKLTQLLLERGSDVTFKGKNGCTALHYACANENQELVKFLVDGHIDINVPNNEGETALHLACKCGDLQMVRLLITNGAQITGTNDKNQTALHYATFEDNSSTDLIDLLLEKLDIDWCDHSNSTPLLHACVNNNLKICTYLLEKGADGNIRNNQGETALHLASSSGHKAIVELLLKHGFDPNVKDCDGVTPVHLACFNGKIWTVQTLVQKGADINCLDKYSQTPLHFAAKSLYKNTKVINFLFENGIYFNARDANGKTALELAHELKNKNVYILQERIAS